MFRWFAVCLLLAAGAVILVAALAGKLPVHAAPTPKGEPGAKGAETPQKPEPKAFKPAVDSEPERRPLNEIVYVTWAPKLVVAAKERGQFLIVHNAHILSDVKQEVPAEQDGKLIFLGTELSPEEAMLIAKLRSESKPMPPWYIEAEFG